jgi:acyl-CoA synthetase (AMP-forming)/AMP-acid ligase II
MTMRRCTFPDVRDLPGALLRHAETQPDGIAAVFLQDGVNEAGRLTFAELAARAKVVAGALQASGHAGKPVIIAVAAGPDYLVALWACLLAGVAGVPMPELNPARPTPRWAGVLRRLDPAAIFCPDEHAEALRASGDGRNWLTVGEAAEAGAAWTQPEAGGESVALVQFTSGSTAQPRGAVITHDALYANFLMVADFLGLEPESRVVTWLPPWHDMGGIGMYLCNIAAGVGIVAMPPLVAVQRPLLWLKAISHYRATHSGGPNFIFETARHQISDEDRRALDLRCWKRAFCGAEPIRAHSLRAFAAAFADAGFDGRALSACYGLAEAVVFVSGERGQDGLSVRCVDGQILRAAGRAVDDPDGRALVSCGRPGLGGTVRVADPDSGATVEDRTVGEIRVSGPHLASGYWGEEAADVFLPAAGDRPAELRTGDLGFLSEGELYVVARLKDVIALRGAKYHAEDIEESAKDAHRAIAGGITIAFGADDGEAERLVIAVEVRRGAAEGLDADEVRHAVTAAVLRGCGIRPDRILLVKSGTIPRTTSGKPQRLLSRRGFEAGAWPPEAAAVGTSDAKAPRAA